MTKETSSADGESERTGEEESEASGSRSVGNSSTGKSNDLTVTASPTSSIYSLIDQIKGNSASEKKKNRGGIASVLTSVVRKENASKKEQALAAQHGDEGHTFFH